MARARKQRSGKAAPANPRGIFKLRGPVGTETLRAVADELRAAGYLVSERDRLGWIDTNAPRWVVRASAIRHGAQGVDPVETVNPPNAPASPEGLSVDLGNELYRLKMHAEHFAYQVLRPVEEGKQAVDGGDLSEAAERLAHATQEAHNYRAYTRETADRLDELRGKLVRAAWPSSPNAPAPSNPKIDAAAFLHDAGAMLTAASGFHSAVWAGDEQTARDLWQGMMDRVDGILDRLGRTGPTSDTYAERGLDPGVAALRNLAYELRALARHPTGDVPESWTDAIFKLARDMRAQLLQLAKVAPYVTRPNPDGSTARLHVTEAAAHLREALQAIDGAELDEGNPAKWSRVHRLVYEWPSGHRRTIRVDATRLTVRQARRTLDRLVAPSGGRFVGTGNPGEFTVPQPPYTAPTLDAEPNPRALVQIGLARELQLDTRTGWKWSIADGWRVLVPAGAEQLAPGAGRIFIVPPPSSAAASTPEPGAAAATFAEWHGFDPRRVYDLDVPRCEEFGPPVGGALRIVYRSDKWDRRPVDYDHGFKASEPPAVSILGTAEAPRAILVRGGVFRTTARGLVD